MQIKSKQRVKDHGEVFTQEREVNAMLDLVKNETERIESRFLEPACGNGNFLAPILERKLTKVKRKYASSQTDFERNAFVAISSIYGVELLRDNVEACIERLFGIIDDLYSKLYKDKCKDDFRKSIRFVLNRNILQGNALTLKKPDGSEHITFSAWSPVRGGMVKRRDFTFDEILKKESVAVGLFATIGKETTKDPFFIPEPIKEFALMHYLKIHYEDAK